MPRALLLAVCVVLVVGAFLIARGSSDDKGSASTQTQTTATQSGAGQGATTDTAPTATPKPPVAAFAIRVQDGKPVGGQKTLQVKKGEDVRIAVQSDTAAKAHLHGYEIEKEVTPGTPTVFAFKAKIDGVFRLELHTEPEVVLAELQVSP